VHVFSGRSREILLFLYIVGFKASGISPVSTSMNLWHIARQQILLCYLTLCVKLGSTKGSLRAIPQDKVSHKTISKIIALILQAKTTKKRNAMNTYDPKRMVFATNWPGIYRHCGEERADSVDEH